MRANDRRQEIMDILYREGSVELKSLAHHFAVSKMTIHRDLDELERVGAVRRIRGGASIESNSQFESHFDYRKTLNSAAKLAIANQALELIEPGMTIVLTDGTTAATLSSVLAQKSPLTVVSNNQAAIDILKGETGITAISLGGAYSRKYNAYFGILTESNLASLRFDIAFITCPATDGVYAYHMDAEVVRTKRAMMGSAAVSCLMVDYSRFNKTAMYTLGPLSDFDHIICDRLPDSQMQEVISASGVSIRASET